MINKNVLKFLVVYFAIFVITKYVFDGPTWAAYGFALIAACQMTDGARDDS